MHALFPFPGPSVQQTLPCDNHTLSFPFLPSTHSSSTAAFISFTEVAGRYSKKTAASLTRTQESESKKMKQSGSSSGKSQKTMVIEKKSACCTAGRIWMQILVLLQILVAIAVIGLYAVCLSETEVSTNGSASLMTTTCYATDKAVQVCMYAYFVGTISIVLSLILLILQGCFPKRRNVFCLSLETLVGMAGVTWWTAAAVTQFVYSQDADDAGVAKSNCRTAAWSLGFANAGIFLVATVTTLTDVSMTCCRRDVDSTDLDF